jgi:hypothetical protein
MRISTASVMIAALAFAPLAFVQAQGVQPKGPAQQQQETQAPSDQSTVIRAIQVVNLKDLKPEARSMVENAAAKTSEDDLKSLRSSIDSTPEAVSALKAKGLSSAQVVAINISDGVLTLFAKTA